jgi:hypothetical protein
MEAGFRIVRANLILAERRMSPAKWSWS